MSLTLGAALTGMADDLRAAGIEDATREARLIAAHVLEMPMARLTVSLGDPLSEKAQARLSHAIAERALRRPLAQVLGRRAFYNHDFLVTPAVLDPRPETETLVDAALAGGVTRLLDLGTGSGSILLSILAERPGAMGIGTDLSQEALNVATTNAARLDLAQRCSFLRSDWFGDVVGRFDLIVSNPPYIGADEMAGLAPELSHEPRMALTDEGDGLSAYRAITAGAGMHLVPGGRLVVEIGWTQGSMVADMFRSAGFDAVSVERDLEGRDRVVSGIWR